MLELLINSEPHRTLLINVLNDAHVAHDISVEGFEGIVNHITTNNYIAFAEEEIPVEGRGHNKALHVSVKCMDSDQHLPTYDPLSHVAQRDLSRLRSAQNAVHLIPLLVLLCAVILWFFSAPTSSPNNHSS